ncbi:type III PLP-dependent enzyme [Actinomadura rubrisoli]|uniref:Type III PLP-dependent enzyme n=1 Tax=Actinomadura rubrisoli TaxID=2530368 RepID=A0A4R5C806_9ACTN|nr:type III PLP-dependent enzyme [Actinomadura rubrisoli]TDD94250.1 type III PLP-dependent enzyme [Actinomadura rubrisoli]
MVASGIPHHVRAAVRAAAAGSHRGGAALSAYFYDVDELTARARSMRAVLPDAVEIFYAVKANSHPAVLGALVPRVTGFEIASGGELDKVRAVAPGVPLILNGPGKSDAEIARFLRVAGGDLINAESVHDLHRIDWFAGRAGVRAQVLIRVNRGDARVAGSHRMAGAATQFGIDPADLDEAVGRARRLRGIAVRGLHLHSVSNCTDAAAYLDFVGGCMRFARELEARYGLPLPVLDVGGGFGVDYSGGAAGFDLRLLAEGLRKPPPTRVILEPGRFLAAPCGYYAAEVLDLKRSHGVAFAVVRGGTHHFRLPAAWRHSHPFAVVPIEDWPHPYPRPILTDAALTVAGELCTPNDVLARDSRVDRIRAGDVLVFPLAGAYAWEISHHDFLSHPHPEIIVVSRPPGVRGRPA